MKSIESCIDSFIEGVIFRKNVDYGSKKSVSKFNAAYDKCERQLRYIDEHYPTQINRIMQLLEHPDIDVVCHCAPIILCLNNASQDQKEYAFGVLQKLTRDPRLNPVSRFGLLMSLEQWEREFLHHST